MEMLLYFKDDYSREDVLVCKRYCGKLFSTSPLGIGARDLLSFEFVSLCDILESLEGTDELDAIREDILLVYRSGKFDGIAVENRSCLSDMMNRFICLCRVRMQGAIGIPMLLDAITGVEIDITTEFRSHVEDEMDLIRDFNCWLINSEIYDKFENLDSKAEKKIMEYVRYGMENKEVMMIQAIMYYDLQSNFVFDDRLILCDGRRIEWRQLLGDDSDSVVQFLCPFSFSMKYLNFDDLIKIKYLNKAVYAVYLSLRRTSSTRPVYKADDSPIFTGVRFWCSNHENFFCDHSVDGKGNSSSLTIRESSLFRMLYSDLSRGDGLLLKRFMSYRSFFEVLSCLTLFFLRRGGQSTKLLEFVDNFRSQVNMGLLLMKISSASNIIIEQITNLFRRQKFNFINNFVNYDLRLEGLSPSDRIQDPQIVDDFLEMRILHSDMEDQFNNGIRVIGTSGQTVVLRNFSLNPLIDVDDSKRRERKRRNRRRQRERRRDRKKE